LIEKRKIIDKTCVMRRIQRKHVANEEKET
jgi:hypothetical protein